VGAHGIAQRAEVVARGGVEGSGVVGEELLGVAALQQAGRLPPSRTQLPRMACPVCSLLRGRCTALPNAPLAVVAGALASRATGLHGAPGVCKLRIRARPRLAAASILNHPIDLELSPHLSRHPVLQNRSPALVVAHLPWLRRRR
jgi:hypothetical protein